MFNFNMKNLIILSLVVSLTNCANFVINFDPNNAIGSDCVESFCENVKDYPQEEIDQLLADDPILASLFEPVTSRKSGNNLEDGDETMCESYIRDLPVRLANNINNEPRTIVQGTNMVQTLRAEVCVENGKCKFQESFPNNYLAGCKQKYVKKRLLCLSDIGTTFTDLFFAPSCCVCAIRPLGF